MIFFYLFQIYLQNIVIKLHRVYLYIKIKTLKYFSDFLMNPIMMKFYEFIDLCMYAY